jgi:hypothetical protein
MSEAVSYEMIKNGEKINPELLEKYIENKLVVLDSWIKKIKEFFVQLDFAVMKLEAQGYDTNLLLLKIEKRREELEKV